MERDAKAAPTRRQVIFVRLARIEISFNASILRKEVIQPQVPLRLPCYDFTPVADLTVVGCLQRLARRLQVKPTPMV